MWAGIGWGSLGLVFLIAVIAGSIDDSGGGSSDVTSQPVADEPDVLRIVTYRVEGPALGDITYQNDGGDTSQDIGAKLPWEETLYPSPGDFLYVSAQNSAAYGTIVCTIEIGGEVVEQNSSEGAYAICTASGAL